MYFGFTGSYNADTKKYGQKQNTTKSQERLKKKFTLPDL